VGGDPPGVMRPRGVERPACGRSPPWPRTRAACAQRGSFLCEGLFSDPAALCAAALPAASPPASPRLAPPAAPRSCCRG
jgi:hypothetical protein